MWMDSSQTLESMLVRVAPGQQEKKPRPADEQALKCPRCDSANTKFCYYNNYSLSQPRYFCKSCRRYWTKGGTLRNVPVGGGCRRNKRSTPSSSSSSSSAKIRSQDQSFLPTSVNHSPLMPLSGSSTPLSSSYDHQSNDLSLAMAMWANNPSMSGEVLRMDNEANHVNTSLGLFDALGSGTHAAFLHHNHEYQQAPCNNFYGSLIMEMNGHDSHQMGSMESNGGVGFECDGGMAMASTALKQEQNKGLWGLPWQINGGDGDVENNQSWNGMSNNWHGLLNSPLM